MSLFRIGKNRILYKVIKLFRVVDFDQAKIIDVHNILSSCLELIFIANTSYPDRYEINYGDKQWKSKKGFDSMFSRIKGEEVVDFSAFFTSSKSLINYENNILNINSTNIPEKSMVGIEIAIPSSSSTDSQIISFLVQLFTQFEYDYGYVVELNEDYDFGSERKLKKRLFSHEISVEQSDLIWQFHSVGVNYGFLKNVYRWNLLNRTHLSQPAIAKCIREKLGTIKKINDKISLWNLTEREQHQVLEFLKKTNLIITDNVSGKSFMESQESKKFYDMMKI